MARAPRADRRTAAPSVHGKRNVDYPLADKTKPVVTERFTRRKSGAHDTAAFLDAHADTTLFPNAKKVKEDGEPGDNQDENLTEVFETLPGTILTSTKLGEQGETETTTQQRVVSGSASVAGGYLVTGDAVQAETKAVDVNTRTTVPSWPVLTEYDQDPEMQSLITRTYQIVDATAVTSSAASGALNAGYIQARVIREFRKMDKWRSLKVETTYSLPANYSEQRFMAYNFETVLRDFDWIDGCGTFIDAEWGGSLMVQARLLHTFSTTRKTIGVKNTNDYVAFRPWTNTFRWGGFSVSNVLNDAGCVVFTGACVGSIDVPASSPSGTAYLALFDDTEQIISGESVLWKAGIYKTSVLYVTFPTKPAVSAGTC